MSFKIGELLIENPVALAPMAGVGNVAFRTLIKQFGAGLIYAEMVSDKAVVYRNEKTMGMLAVDEIEHPMALQIFGAQKDSFIAAAQYVDTHSQCDIIDINMGCPVPKVTKNEAGAKLLLDSAKVYDIVSAVVQHVHKPVTVKMRIGWDSEHINVIENAKAVEEAGAQAVAIHGRTAKQLYTGTSQWSHIKDVKDNVTIPVIGNGDIKVPEDALRMIEETGCDGVMIGRAALGNPWMIEQTVSLLTKGSYEDKVSYQKKLATAIEHFDRLIILKGERIAVLEMRSHLSWYAKGLPGSIQFKQEVQIMSDVSKMKELISRYQTWLDERSNKNEEF